MMPQVEEAGLLLDGNGLRVDLGLEGMDGVEGGSQKAADQGAS
jgi:hypothetical protein